MPNKEKAKEILKKYKQLITRRNQLTNVITNLERNIQSVKGANLEPNLVGDGNSTISQKIARLVDLQVEFELINQQIYTKVLIIEKVLQKVAEEGVLYANILHYKFVDLMNIESIAVIIRYSYRQTIRIYNAALIKFYKNFSEVEK